MDDKWIQIATSAPVSFDRSHCRRVCDKYAYNVVNRGDDIVRIVEIFGEAAAELQMQRYADHLYLGMKKESFDRQMVLYPDYYEILNYGEEQYHRIHFCFENAVAWGCKEAILHLLEVIQAIQHYPNVQLTTKDGGFSYELEVKGTWSRFDTIHNEITNAYSKGAKMSLEALAEEICSACAESSTAVG